MKYPENIEVKGQIVKLIDIPKPEGNYVMLEEVSRDRGEALTVYVISLHNKDNVRLGRGNDSDVRFNDISVSRNHAFIKVSRLGLYL